MPRLPTILVIGSQDMSTTWPASGWMRSRVAMISSPLASCAPARCVARGQLLARVTPLGLLVDRLVGDPAQPADDGPVDPGDRGRDRAAGRLVHERHELVGEAGHRAADADAAHPRAAGGAGHPAPLGDVAVDDRPPAAGLDQALGRVVVAGE